MRIITNLRQKIERRINALIVFAKERPVQEEDSMLCQDTRMPGLALHLAAEWSGTPAFPPASECLVTISKMYVATAPQAGVQTLSHTLLTSFIIYNHPEKM